MSLFCIIFSWNSVEKYFITRVHFLKLFYTLLKLKHMEAFNDHDIFFTLNAYHLTALSIEYSICTHNRTMHVIILLCFMAINTVLSGLNPEYVLINLICTLKLPESIYYCLFQS